MSIIAGDQDARKNFLNYALSITRIDLASGERLAVEHLRLRSPFKIFPIDPSGRLGRVIQGAADGSESTLVKA